LCSTTYETLGFAENAFDSLWGNIQHICFTLCLIGFDRYLIYLLLVVSKCKDSKGVAQLEADAVKELKAGRPQLLDFIRKNKSSLPDLLDYCWSLNTAEQRLERLSKSRMDILLETATDPWATCANGNRSCSDVYDSILQHQSICSVEFRHKLAETFRQGRRKGNALMIVGGKDTGKTTVTEPAAQIFKTMETPQSDSFCPLQDIRGHEICLWQDFRYNPGHRNKDEHGLRLDEGTWNRLLEGLPTRIGVAKTDGSRSDFVYRENTPFIFTGPFKLVAYRNGKADEVETDQISCRLQYVNFERPAPKSRNRAFKHCPSCWSRWLLIGELMWQQQRGIEPGPFCAKARDALNFHPLQTEELPQPPRAPAAELQQPVPSESAHPDFFTQLRSLMEWHTKGLLSDSEFKVAKSKLGLH
jgi:hypothetical protein